MPVELLQSNASSAQ